MENKSQKGKRILIVDDVTTVLKYLSIVLTRGGYRVIQAENGTIALQQYEENKDDIDLILLDMQLPDISGFEIAAKIRETDTHLPIIAQTALAMEEEKENAINAGCTDVILKPLDIQELHEIIEKYL